ncbi:MAG: hypothetical protein K2F99_08790, partial [Muribaculaceae bacterium]|nr:hypothetical protein [Muribaculaceae bacterium]
MANGDVIKSYESAAEITQFWLNEIVPRYFDADKVNTYRAGTFGYINDILSTTAEDSMHAMIIAKREVLPNTAKFTKSLYLHAAARLMDAPMGIPATANVLLMFQESELLKYGTTQGNLHTFILDDTFVAKVDGIPFMMDYPLVILSQRRENGRYAHTTHYDLYVNNTLADSVEKYLPNKMLHYRGTDYLIVEAKMRQLYRSHAVKLVTANTIISTVTMDFMYDGMLANFEVFYKEDDSSPEVQLLKVMEDSNIPKVPFCWYKIVDEYIIRLMFPANVYFAPKLNSTIRIEIYTTLGSGGNFDQYNSDIISENTSTKYPYNTQVPVFGTVDGPSSGGADTIETEEFREAVMRAYATNMTFITNDDLQRYFDTLMVGTKDRFKFTKQRDDSFVRLHGAFLRMRDSTDNVVPTNTLDIILDPLESAADFDIYADAVKRRILKPGALFTYRHDTTKNKYILRRIHD